VVVVLPLGLCMIYLPKELHDAKVSKERCKVGL
jgi:hypothetical protein